MNLDIRFPIGMMFSIIGTLMALHGYFSRADGPMYQCSLGININLIWGLVLVLFGGTMLLFAMLGRRHAAEQSKTAAPDRAKQTTQA
ncbi:MAG: hypothetical protein ACFUZC_15125 [Chthoniobacteraceae bacterium]